MCGQEVTLVLIGLNRRFKTPVTKKAALATNTNAQGLRWRTLKVCDKHSRSATADTQGL